MPRRKKKHHITRFYQKHYKIPESQQLMLKEFCQLHRTTENKVFRKALREYLHKHFHLVERDPSEVSPNQLSLFD